MGFKSFEKNYVTISKFKLKYLRIKVQIPNHPSLFHGILIPHSQTFQDFSLRSVCHGHKFTTVGDATISFILRYIFIFISYACMVFTYGIYVHMHIGIIIAYWHWQFLNIIMGSFFFSLPKSDALSPFI